MVLHQRGQEALALSGLIRRKTCPRRRRFPSGAGSPLCLFFRAALPLPHWRASWTPPTHSRLYAPRTRVTCCFPTCPSPGRGRRGATFLEGGERRSEISSSTSSELRRPSLVAGPFLPRLPPDGKSRLRTLSRDVYIAAREGYVNVRTRATKKRNGKCISARAGSCSRARRSNYTRALANCAPRKYEDLPLLCARTYTTRFAPASHYTGTCFGSRESGGKHG